MEEKSSVGWVVVAIVAIVAIVGLVLLFKANITGSAIQEPTLSGCQPTQTTDGTFACLGCNLIVGAKAVSLPIQPDERGGCPYDGQTISDWYQPRIE